MAKDDMTWEVEYDLTPPIPVDAPRIPAYPVLGIALEYDAEGNLAKIVHKLNADAGTDPSLAMERSQRALEPVFETLEFFHGLAPQIARRRARITDPENDTGHSVGRMTITSNAYLVVRVQLPKEATLSAAAAKPRLVTLLHLFNRARRPTSDAEAVRLYYMIWEDLHGPPDGKEPPSPELRLRHTRDFVSHGVTLGNGNARKFIQPRINNKQFTAFDPKDPDHCAFVAAQRAEAFTLIEGELRQKL